MKILGFYTLWNILGYNRCKKDQNIHTLRPNLQLESDQFGNYVSKPDIYVNYVSQHDVVLLGMFDTSLQFYLFNLLLHSNGKTL